MFRNTRLVKIGYAGVGLLAGGVLATTLSAHAATTPTPTTTTTSSSSAAAADPNPGDNGADGVPEAQEVHSGGGHGGGLNLSGTVTAVGTSSVTIKTATGTTEYSVSSSSDIDKNGEAAVSNLAAGDAVTFSVDSANGKQIDKLHAGDEAKNRPQCAGIGSTSAT